MIKNKNISVITLEVDYIIPNSKIRILRIKADVWPGSDDPAPNISIGFPDLGPSEIDAKTGAMMQLNSMKELQTCIDDFKNKIKLITNKTI